MNPNKAFGVLEVKSMDEELREFSGIASSITPDRDGEVLVPKGAKFTLPIPLFAKHDKTKPIGEVFWAKVGDKAIEYKARIAKILEDGTLKQRVDEAWQEIKYGLVRGVSVGFLPDYKNIEIMPSGGVIFKSWEWLELSPVPIPANVDASIENIKAIGDTRAVAEPQPQSGAASGAKKKGATVSLGAAGKTSKGKDPMDIAKQLEALRAKRAELIEERTALQTKAVDEGRTKSAEERERFDTITAEVAEIDQEIKDLSVLLADAAASAKPVAGESAKAAAASRAGSTAQVGGSGGHIQVRDNRIRPEGLAMAQYMRLLHAAGGSKQLAAQFAANDQSIDPRVPLALKTAVEAGSTISGNWSANLVGSETSVFADFVEYLRPRTIVGRFGNGGIPALRSVPFRVPLISQDTAGSGYWVGEGKSKPLTKFGFQRTTLSPLKVANIAAVTEELLKYASPSADALLRDQLVAALAERMDTDFVDPTKAASADVSPASILNGVTGLSSSGSDADSVRADLRALWAPFISANNPPTTAVYLMPATTALALSLMMNQLGQPEFPNISVNGGTLNGVPVIASQYLINSDGSAGGIVALVNASDIYYGDEGGFDVALSREASLVMADDPSADSVTPTAAQVVSMFQTNSVAFRAERVVNWARRRSVSVTWLDAVTWGQ